MTPFWPGQNTPLSRFIADFVSREIYCVPGKFRDYTALGVFDSCVLVAGVLYYDYDRDAGVLQISAAATTPRWLTRSILWDIFDFPFNQLKCQAIVMRVDPANRRLERILKAYGFSAYKIPRLRGREKAEMLYLLGDDVWRQNNFHKRRL
ncbi:MAG: N-acetyltransferase [Alphaproteobacteria bacterium]|nr:N-acetyltransferase [Alphaproteobacteria bacterium]